MVCSSKCLAYRGSKISRKKTQINQINNQRNTGLCEWCSKQNFSANHITPEKALTYILTELALETLGIKKPVYIKMTDYVITSNVGKHIPKTNGFVVSTIHLKCAIDWVLPGNKYPVGDITNYLKLSPIKFEKDPTNKRTTVSLNRYSDLAEELGSRFNKSARWRYYYKDFECLEDFSGQCKAIEDTTAAKLCVTLENL